MIKRPSKRNITFQMEEIYDGPKDAVPKIITEKGVRIAGTLRKEQKYNNSRQPFSGTYWISVNCIM